MRYGLIIFVLFSGCVTNDQIEKLRSEMQALRINIVKFEKKYDSRDLVQEIENAYDILEKIDIKIEDLEDNAKTIRREMEETEHIKGKTVRAEAFILENDKGEERGRFDTLDKEPRLILLDEKETRKIGLYVSKNEPIMTLFDSNYNSMATIRVTKDQPSFLFNGKDVKPESISIAPNRTKEAKTGTKQETETQTEASFFGFKLGENISEVKKRIKGEIQLSKPKSADKDNPALFCSVPSYSPTVKSITLGTYNSRVYFIGVDLSDASEKNYEALKEELTIKYGKELDSGLAGIVFGGEKSNFSKYIDGIDVRILLKFEKSIFKENSIIIGYWHSPLYNECQKEIKRRKASKISSEI